MKALVLVFTVVGVAPAVLVSLWIIYVSCSVAPHYAPQLEKERFSLTRRIEFTQILQGRPSTFRTVAWIPIAVVALGTAFLLAVILFLYSPL